MPTCPRASVASVLERARDGGHGSDSPVLIKEPQFEHRSSKIANCTTVVNVLENEVLCNEHYFCITLTSVPCPCWVNLSIQMELVKFKVIASNEGFMLDPDAQSAKTLTLVAVILQVVFLLIAIVVVLFAGIAGNNTVVTTYFSNGTAHKTQTVTVTSSAPIFGLTIVVILILVIGLMWVLLDYFLVYRELAHETVDKASTPAIVLGILQLIFGGLIPGILLIVAYVKIRDSVNRRYSSQGQQKAPP